MDKKQQSHTSIQKNTKNHQLEDYRKSHGEQLLTTNQGVRVSNTDDSLKAGDRGPTLMEDFHFREKLTHFDHERIPERVVHARGFGVHGYFQVYESMAEFTKAKFLQDPSVKTPVFVRFSTVVGSRGSADTVRDVRGFATKFYTEEGNYDLVANNIPVFFIQDAIKFPDVVHAIKPEPNNEIPQASAAHDTFWDFVVNTPETAHMIMWLLSDRAIPRSFRMMEGFGVNTFRFINHQGKARFVKFHWKPLLGVHSLVWDEAQKLAGKDPDYHRRDLWDAINMGAYPEYELGVQMLEEEEEFNFDFDILDPTKIWPEEIIPVRRIGKMTLDGNVDNFFAETEQVAFHPGHVVPGIDFSNDPLLQGRLFSYLDTQLIRLGGPNFHEIPINRPVAPIHNNQRDGYHRMTIDRSSVSYSPNSLQGNAPMPASETEGGYVHYEEKVEGKKVRQRSQSFQDHYSQATLFWNSMSTAEKQHIIEAFHFEVGSVMDKQIKQRVVDMFNNVDGQLAAQIAAGVGATPPANPGNAGITASSPAVSQENTVKDAKTRKVAILLENGFNHQEVSQVMEALTAAGVHSEIISKNLGMLTSVDGQQLEVGKNYVTTGSIKYDAVYIAGGQQSINTLMMQGDALHFINEAFKHAKTIGATNEGIDLLMASAIQGVAMAGADTQAQVITEMGVITVRNVTDMKNFTKEFINGMAQHRHWIRQNKKQMIPA
ncbi:catalase [Clostridium formicaceticum]|uniref:Catalase n=1 Tax=Clostridium formicaceticum TaxID=1497 RepID=A0AAC9WGN8_9CLOT|nr:catalase [Clostridium formicaceticum]AOY77473.1 catalase HPII [Clostridium formicaceticum]ARE88036.1 Catalase HPII [Clostridium formicaceticum]